jgi:pantetheine-phosphate adenylyltransferase
LRTAVYPGSFDPLTYGHLDIISRSAGLFDRLFVGVLENSTKQVLFPCSERVKMLQEATAHLPNVICESFQGLTVDYARKRQAVAIVRGLRAVSDFEFEFKLAAANRHLAPEIETIFMMTSQEYSFLSSSIVKEVADLGGPVRGWVPAGVARRLEERFQRSGKAGGNQ